MKPADQFLLPVEMDSPSIYGTRSGKWFVLGEVDNATLIPADRITQLEAEVERLRELVEAAYGEGWDDGHDTDRTFVPVGYDVRSEDWRDSSAIKKLNPATSEKEAG